MLKLIDSRQDEKQPEVKRRNDENQLYCKDFQNIQYE